MPPVPFSSNIGARYDHHIAAGTDYAFKAGFQNPDGTPTDITGMTNVAAIRKTPSGPVLTNFNITVLSNTVFPQLLLTLPYAQVELLPSAQFDLDQNGKSVYDLKTTDSLGKVGRFLWGDIFVWREVTP